MTLVPIDAKLPNARITHWRCERCGREVETVETWAPFPWKRLLVGLGVIAFFAASTAILWALTGARPGALPLLGILAGPIAAAIVATLVIGPLGLIFQRLLPPTDIRSWILLCCTAVVLVTLGLVDRRVPSWTHDGFVWGMTVSGTLALGGASLTLGGFMGRELWSFYARAIELARMRVPCPGCGRMMPTIVYGLPSGRSGRYAAMGLLSCGGCGYELGHWRCRSCGETIPRFDPLGPVRRRLASGKPPIARWVGPWRQPP